MPMDNKVLRNVIKLILESDDDEEEVEFTKDDGERATKSSGRVPRGAHEYRTATGEIVTIPDYSNPPKMSLPYKWSDESSSSQTTAGSQTVEQDVLAKTVVDDMKSSSDKQRSTKYNIQQSQVGERFDPIEPEKRKQHAGIDITRLVGPTEGVTVVAAQGGTIIKVVTGKTNDRTPAGGYGNQVIIKHADGSGARYGHLAAVYFTEGTPNNPATINAKAALGIAGNTGKSTGPHLHFEYITGFDENNNPLGTVDPATFFRKAGVYYPLQPEVKV